MVDLVGLVELIRAGGYEEAIEGSLGSWRRRLPLGVRLAMVESHRERSVGCGLVLRRFGELAGGMVGGSNEVFGVVSSGWEVDGDGDAVVASAVAGGLLSWIGGVSRTSGAYERAAEVAVAAVGQAERLIVDGRGGHGGGVDVLPAGEDSGMGIGCCVRSEPPVSRILCAPGGGRQLAFDDGLGGDDVMRDEVAGCRDGRCRGERQPSEGLVCHDESVVALCGWLLAAGVSSRGRGGGGRGVSREMPMIAEARERAGRLVGRVVGGLEWGGAGFDPGLAPMLESMRGAVERSAACVAGAA